MCFKLVFIVFSLVVAVVLSIQDDDDDVKMPNQIIKVAFSRSQLPVLRFPVLLCAIPCSERGRGPLEYSNQELGEARKTVSPQK